MSLNYYTYLSIIVKRQIKDNGPKSAQLYWHIIIFITISKLRRTNCRRKIEVVNGRERDQGCRRRSFGDRRRWWKGFWERRGEGGRGRCGCFGPRCRRRRIGRWRKEEWLWRWGKRRWLRKTAPLDFVLLVTGERLSRCSSNCEWSDKCKIQIQALT